MKKEEKEKLTFTKRCMTIILAVSIIDLQFSYILAWFGKDIAETLAVAIVTEIIGCFLGYLAKSFLETKEEEKNKLIEAMSDDDEKGDNEG